MSVYSYCLCSCAAISFVVSLVDNSGLIVIALDVETYLWRRLNSSSDITEGLLNGGKIVDVLSWSVATGPNDINQVHTHNAEQAWINNNSQRNGSIESKHQDNRTEHVEWVTSRDTRLICLNFHVVLINYLLFSLIFCGDNSNSI